MKENEKNTKNYLNFSYLDDGVDGLDINDFPSLYEKYNDMYQRLKMKW